MKYFAIAVIVVVLPILTKSASFSSRKNKFDEMNNGQLQHSGEIKDFETEMTDKNLNTEMNSLFDVESEPMIMSRMKRSNKRKNKLTLKKCRLFCFSDKRTGNYFIEHCFESHKPKRCWKCRNELNCFKNVRPF